jgi:4'-phosphopantetheinyl transferase
MEMSQTLSSKELKRAASFNFKKDSDSFIKRRWFLRKMLGRYLKSPPESLKFSYSANGKPYICGEFLDSGINFNLSHSYELALYAFTLNRRIGVDIEHIRPIAEMSEIVVRFFSAIEKEEWENISPSQKKEAFFSYWSLKEAYLKARGEGLSIPLDKFTVSLEPPALLGDASVSQEPHEWTLDLIYPASGYTGALAVEGKKFQVVCLQWPPSVSA